MTPHPTIPTLLAGLFLLFISSCSCGNGSGLGVESDGDFEPDAELPAGDEDISSPDGDLDGDDEEAENLLDGDAPMDGDETEDDELENADGLEEEDDNDGIPSDGDSTEEEPADGDGDDDTDEDNMEDEEEIEEDIELLNPHPLSGLCTPPEPRLARWMLEFPRVPNFSRTWTVQTLTNNAVALSGNHISLFPEEGEPATYYPQAGKFYNAVQAPSGDWFLISLQTGYHGIWRYQGMGHDWELVYTGAVEGQELIVDTDGVLWSYRKLQPTAPSSIQQPIFRWDGREGRSISIQSGGPNEQSYAGIKVAICEGRKYLFGAYWHEDRGQAATIFRLNEEETELVPIWQPPEGDGWILSASVAPNGCDFFAVGYSIWVEGRLGDPLTIDFYERSIYPESRGYVGHKDWETGTRFSMPFGRIGCYNCSGETQPSAFARWSEDRSTCYDVGLPWGFFEDWGVEFWNPYQMGGPDLNHIYVAAVPIPFRYDPVQDFFVVAYEHPLLLPPGYMKNSQFWSLVTHEDNEGNYRLHATGPSLPVMRRTGCQEWEETGPGSEWVYTLFDTGERLLGVGHGPGVWGADPRREKPALYPGGGWIKGLDIVESVNGETYVVALPEESSVYQSYYEAVLYYKPTPAQDSGTAWRRLAAPVEHPVWYATYVERSASGPTLLVAALKRPDNNAPSGEAVVYRLEGETVTEIARVDSDAALHVHGEEYILSSCNGAWSIDPETGALQQEVEPILDVEATGKWQWSVNFCLFDAVRVDNTRWVVASSDLYEYDSLMGEYTAPITAVTGGDTTSSAYPMDPVQYMRTFYSLTKLPTGEVLAAAAGGRIFRRLTDGQWYLGEE